MNFLTTLFLLLACHCIADYAWQGDFMAKAKNRANPIPGVPWYQAMGAHAMIHGGLVFLVTGYLSLGIAEAVCHAITDDLKCRGKISYNADQALHVFHKLLWALAVALAA